MSLTLRMFSAVVLLTGFPMASGSPPRACHRHIKPHRPAQHLVVHHRGCGTGTSKTTENQFDTPRFSPSTFESSTTFVVFTTTAVALAVFMASAISAMAITATAFIVMNTSTTTEKSVHDCFVDENGDKDDPNNIFTCDEGQSCCTVDLNPACCASKDIEEEIMDQVKLWLPLLAIILILAIFIWWCRSDDSCCDVEKPCLYRFGCKKYEDLEEDCAETGSQLSLRSNKSGTTILVTDDGQEHDAAELELAADNLEVVLDEGEEEDDDDEEEPTKEEESTEQDEGKKEDEDNEGAETTEAPADEKADE
eukprot:maker-scaffold1182_size56756-snap-gene-0.9 protein:Tk09771 transcript:maker-scaffold1182_size56756-snap-gene-0.9-mRNA-1 annotation:"PREDICTED: uncharacterized protein LOC100897291"